jgi:hypothetical protein
MTSHEHRMIAALRRRRSPKEIVRDFAKQDTNSGTRRSRAMRIKRIRHKDGKFSASPNNIFFHRDLFVTQTATNQS